MLYWDELVAVTGNAEAELREIGESLESDRAAGTSRFSHAPQLAAASLLCAQRPGSLVVCSFREQPCACAA